MFNFSIEQLLEITVRTLLVYAVVLLGIRLTGKRQVGQLTPFELVFLLLISNSVQNAMTGPDTSIPGGVTAALTLFVLTAILSWLSFRNRRLRRMVEGVPTLLISHGNIILENLAKEHLSLDDLHVALREHGVLHPQEVELAVLEVDGSISVVKAEDLKDEATIKTRKGFRHIKDKS